MNLNQWMDYIGTENQQGLIYASQSEEIIRKLTLKSSEGGYKVMIIWMAMLFKGECSSEEYLEAMKILEKERAETVEQYHLKQEALGIDTDLKAADAYAKEHNLKWGIIYE